MGNELQRFPVLKKHIDKVIGEFLRDGLEPSEIMIEHIIDMEMDYLTTSHPNFIGGSKAVEDALLQVKSARAATAMEKEKEGVVFDKVPPSERSQKLRSVLGRSANGITADRPSPIQLCGTDACHLLRDLCTNITFEGAQEIYSCIFEFFRLLLWNLN
ncbi:hypothetical protein MKW98_019939 [Papaver atlanticum]|uniref:Dynamin stalk domain-containing protein n=1 Tax=Papaver atlanticum TaxID=357466 RepID=A0AAD4X602_9MAGN|nr:hypothetical protein MKW98_019939 [Papaver atlanticum]